MTMFKIEKLTEGTATVLRLVGRINTQHLEELRKLIADAEPRVKLDLSEVTLVDVDVIRFLGNQERRGIQLVNCSRYVREWIQREQTTNSTERHGGGVDAEEGG
jgi:anti-anti-sigma regulatory factor